MIDLQKSYSTKKENIYNKLIVFVIDSLVAGGAEKVCLTLAKTLIEKYNCNVYIYLFDNIIDFNVDFDLQIKKIKSKKLEKTSRLFSSYKYKKYAQILEHEFQTIEKKECKNIDLILSNLLQSDRTLTYSNRDNIFFCIHNTQSIKLKLAKKAKIEAYRRKKSMQKRYNDKNIITVSRGVANDFTNIVGIKPKTIKTIYNPFDVEEIKTQALIKNNNIPQENYIVSVSSFKPQKNLPRLLKAFYLADLPCKLVVVGRGTEKELEVLKKYAKELGIIKKVIFAGLQSNPYSWIKQAKLFVLSSDYEGLPTVLIESLICETLPVSTNCPSGPSEILNNGLAKYLSNLTVEDLAEKIVMAYQEDGKINFPKYYNRYSTNKIAEQYLNLCSNLINKI